MSYHHGNLRKQILARAAEVIAREGIEKLSLRAIARDLGVSHSAPARHFKDKTAIIEALATESFSLVVAALDAATEAAGTDPMSRYNAIGKALVGFALEHPAYYRAMNHPEVRIRTNAALMKAHTDYMTRLLQAAREAQAAGWLEGHSPETAVLFSTAAAQGVAQILADPFDGRLFAGRTPKEIGDEVIDIVIAPQSPAPVKTRA
ncbi:TetR/AcrR family transcriptional regulator [Pyruvatibacter mobilis]|uniref:TetR/AcrR family transcriptional regulator n=1 Tax=Pyruvatibacter mobilis TaxID=1712261 RepID=UPI003BAADEED